MKKMIFSGLLLVTGIIVLPQLLQAQSVAINADSSKADASAILDLKSTKKGMLLPRMTMSQRGAIAAPAMGLLIYQTDNNSGYYYFDGSAWTPLKSTSGGSGGTDMNWLANGTDIQNSNSGNVIIGAGSAFSKLTVQTGSGQFGLTHTDGNVRLSTYIDAASGAWLGTTSRHSLLFFVNSGSPRIVVEPAGNVGIGVTNPVNKFQIGSFSGAAVSGNDLSIAGNGNWMAIKEFTDHTEMATSSNLAIFPTGGLGLFTRSIGNKVQIGDAPGVSGTDFAIGNNGNWLAIKEFSDHSEIATSSNLAIFPNGFVGINTRTPRAPLDVVGFALPQPLSGLYVFLGHSAEIVTQVSPGPINNISIIASGNIYAHEFDSYSDARIKDILGRSSAAKDLQAVNALRITDYTMKDRMAYGDKTFKKVIAQEVEKIYPQLVSKHRDFIPNVYQLTNGVQKTDSGLMLFFEGNHHISRDAKKIKAILSDKTGMSEYRIVSIPNNKQVEIEAAAADSSKVFVYGEEVNDFRTVDYEGLTTLNISATQEISRLVTELRKTVAAQNQKITQLTRAVAMLRQPLVNKLSRNIISSNAVKNGKPVSRSL